MDEKVKEEMLLSNLDTDINVLKKYDTGIFYDEGINNDEETNENDNYIELDENLEKK